MHLLLQTFTTKYEQLILRMAIQYKNKNLEQALDTIGVKNKRISEIMDNQQEIIAERTAELRSSYKRLQDIANMNAHDVREPLTRILGLIDIVNEVPQEELPHSKLINMLTLSARDLDRVIQNIINVSTENP